MSLKIEGANNPLSDDYNPHLADQDPRSSPIGPGVHVKINLPVLTEQERVIIYAKKVERAFNSITGD